MSKGRRGRAARKPKSKQRPRGQAPAAALPGDVELEEAEQTARTNPAAAVAAKPVSDAVVAEKRLEQPPKQAKKREAARPGIGARMAEYFLSLKYEWLKVSFPARKELVQSTIVVFLFTIALMTVISVYDLLMSLVFNRLILPLPSGG